MASTATPATDYEQALDEVARLIKKHRRDCPPRETARQLLEYETPGNTGLVGVDDDATRAVLYHERDRYVVAVGFGPDGLEEGGPVLADFGTFGSNVYTWARKWRYYWGWLNPRFR